MLRGEYTAAAAVRTQEGRFMIHDGFMLRVGFVSEPPHTSQTRLVHHDLACLRLWTPHLDMEFKEMIAERIFDYDAAAFDFQSLVAKILAWWVGTLAAPLPWLFTRHACVPHSAARIVT